MCESLPGGRFQSNGGLKIVAARHDNGVHKKHYAQCVQKISGGIKRGHPDTEGNPATAIPKSFHVVLKGK